MLLHFEGKTSSNKPLIVQITKSLQDFENQFLDITSCHEKESCEGEQPLPAPGDGTGRKSNFLPRVLTCLSFSSCVEIKAIFTSFREQA